MNEKRECTNPDCIEGEVLKMESEVLMEDNEYRELCSKATALDILAADLKAKIDYGYNYNLVNDDLVLAVTGMGAYKRKKEFEERQKLTLRGEEEPDNE